jgi:hypothetical protein
MHYCRAVLAMPETSLHHHYHDAQYGFPIENDDELFGRLILEINQGIQLAAQPKDLPVSRAAGEAARPVPGG